MEKNWLQLSDLHLVRVYTDKNDKTGEPDIKRTEFASVILRQCKDHMFQGKHIDFVVITGDFRNIFDKNSSGFSDAVFFIRTLFDQDHLNMDLSKELFLIPGNHDNNKDSEYTDATPDGTRVKSEMLDDRRGIIAGLLPEGYGEIREKADQLRTASDEEKTNLEEELEKYRRSCEKGPEKLLKKLQDACVKKENELLIQPFSTFEEELAQKLIPGVYTEDHRASSVHVRTLYTSNSAPYLNIIHLNTAIAADGNRWHYQFADLTGFAGLINSGEINASVPSIILAHNSFYDLHPAVRDELRKLMELANVWAWLCGDEHKSNRYSEHSVIAKPGSYRSWPNIVCSKSSADVTDDYSDFGMLWYSWDGGIVNVESLDWDPRGTDLRSTCLKTFSMNEFCSAGLLDILLARLEKDRKENPSFQLVYRNESLTKTEKTNLLKEEIRPELIPLAKLTVKENSNSASAPQTLRDLFQKSWSESLKNHLLIEGEGGIGKTVSLLTLALEDGLFPHLTPAIYIPLRSIPLSEDTDLLGKYLREEICDGNSETWKEVCALAEKKWTNGPGLILLIDGFNEVGFEARGKITASISAWANKSGVQIIMTSRLDGAFFWDAVNAPVQKVRLQPLSREIITDYLKSKNVAVPKPGNSIWNVIDLPLLLVLYANVKEQKRRFRSHWLSWAEGSTAGALIWNYLQTEIQRFRDLGYSGKQLFSIVCLVEYIAPAICWQMVSNQDPLKNISGFEISEEQYDIYFDKALEWFLRLLDSGKNERINSLSAFCKRETRESFSGFSDREIDYFKEMLKEEINLFRPVERNGKTYYALMHQNFRDCLAAVYLIQQIGCLGENELEDWQKDSVKWEILCYFSELIGKEKEDLLWETNRTCATENTVTTRNLLLFEKLYRNADYSSLNFSEMDLENISLYPYTDIHRKINLPANGSLLEGTKFGLWNFSENGHSSTVTCVAVTPDGSRCVSGSNDNTLCIWNMNSGELLHVLKGHMNSVTCVAVTPDGSRCVSGSFDHSLRIWDMQSGELLHVLKGHDWGVNCVAVAPDGSRCVSGSDDHSLRIWDMNSGELLHVLKGHDWGVNCVAVAPDGSRCVSGSDDNTLRIWDMQSGELLHVLEGHADSVTCVAVTPDGSKCVSGSEDNTLCIWDLHSGELLHVLEGHDTSVSCVAVTPDGSRCVSGSADKTTRIWDLHSGRLLYTLDGHDNSVNCVAVTTAGSRCVSGSADHTLRIWNIQNGELLHILEGYDGFVNCVAVTPDGSRCVSGSADHTLRIWDIQNGELLHILEGYDGFVNCVAVTPDGSQCMSGSWDRTLRIWDMQSGKLLYVLEGHDKAVTCVAVTPDGSRCVSGSDDNTLRIWDINSGESLHVLNGHDWEVTCVAVTPDGSRCISGSDDSTLRIWDMHSGELLHVLKEHSAIVTCVAVTPDGSQCISGSGDKTLCVWDLQSGSLLHVLKGHADVILCVAVTPDGSRCVSGSWDHTLRIWDMHSGELLHVLNGHDASAYHVAVTPDGSRCVSGSADNTLRIWDMHSGKLLHVLKGHDWGVNCVALTPDGSRCVSGSWDKTIRIWDMHSGKLLHMLEGYEHAVYRLIMTCNGNKCVFTTDKLNILDMETYEVAEIEPFYGINVMDVDFSKAIMDEKLRTVLWQNGAKC